MKPFSSESQELCQIHLTVFYTPGNSVQWVEPLFVISPVFCWVFSSLSTFVFIRLCSLACCKSLSKFYELHLLLLLIYLFSLSFLFFIQFLFSVFSPSVITCFHFLCQSFLLYSLSVIITLFSLFFLWAYFVIPSPLFSLFSFLLLRFFSLVSLPRALIFLFHSLGCSDSEHRWEPGLPRPPGMVPVRHIQPVPVRSRRHLLLHRPGKCSQHQAARRECSHWHSGGKMGL